MATQLTLNDGSLNSAGALAIKTNGTTQAINITTGQQVEFNDGSASAPSITNTGDGNTGVFFPDADTVGITTGGTERARVDSSGNLGLGVTPFANSLSKGLDWVNGAGVFGNSNNAYWSANAYYDSAWKYKATAAAAFLGMESGSFRFNIAASGTAGNAITFTEAMRLDASGNLGVGTTSPATTLHVYKTSGTSSIRVASGSATGEVASLQFYGTDSGSAAQIYSQIVTGVTTNTAGSEAGYIGLETTNAGSTTEKARIDSSGNLLVGTTTTISSAAFTLVGSVANNVAYIRNTNATPYGLRVNYSAVTPNNTDFWFYYASDATAQRFEVRSNGGIANYSANNVNLSDSREKTNVNPAGDYLAKICAIPVRTYNYIDQNLEEDDGLTLGVFAQDVQAVAPELVTESNWAAKDEEPKMRLSIYQTDLQYALMKCIQEQQAMIASQSAIITQLQADVANVRSELTALKGQA